MECQLKIGQPVQLAGKQLKGHIAYVGLTHFSPGKWVGVVLDEEKGKNNGCVKGIAYFTCPPNYGLFVRPTQLQCLEEAADEAATATTEQLDAVKLESDEQPTGSAGNHLKTTKISQPKQIKQFLANSSRQMTLHAVESGSIATASTVKALPPKRSKTSVSPSETFCCVKRASFVETGFLEILRPQFTPGHPLRSPSFCVTSGAAESLSDLKQARKELEAKILSLTEENAILKRQRIEDKEKLRELEKMRLQNEQFLEFKSQIMEQQGLLQRDFQRARHELRETHEAKLKYKRELDELAESIEMLTLDKEMAEERAETLQIELELSQERVEELLLDVEILRSENEGILSVRDCPKNDVPTVGEVRKLEQYNQRLRETVVRLRDVLTQEKQNLQKSNKELETKYSEITELKKTKEVLSKRIDVMELHIIDLKEQVDAALGAESMVSSLVETKLELEDRVRLLEEEVAELEALEEIQAQLIEGNQELELDLREEIDKLNASLKTLQREKDNALEVIYDRDVTIVKFRELVKSLRDATTTSISEDFSAISPLDETQSVDFNQVFSVTKAYSRAIDSQLNAIELNLARLHADYLLAFMSEDFMLRGGEHDVILVLILLQRLIEKVNIVCNAIHEKFPASCELAKDSIFEGFSVHRFAFRSMSMYFLRSIKMVLQQITFTLNHCDYEVCSHAAIYRNEIEAQERHIDEVLRLFKSGLFDENSSVDALKSSLNFFLTLQTNLISTQHLPDIIDEKQLYGALIEVFDAGFDCVLTNAELLKTIIQIGDEATESFAAMQFLVKNMAAFKQTLKQLSRKFPSATITFGGMRRENMDRIQLVCDYLTRLLNILTCSTREALKESAAKAYCSSMSINHDKLWQILTINYIKMGPEDCQSLTQMFQRCMDLMTEQFSEFFSFVEENENARNTNVNTMCIRSSMTTLLQRSALMREHFESVKTLQHNLAEREKEIKSLKYMAKLKQNDFSELQVRKEMAERNLLKVQKLQEEVFTSISAFAGNLLQQVEHKNVIISEALSNLETKITGLDQNCQGLQKKLTLNCQTNDTATSISTREIIALRNLLCRERAEQKRQNVNELRNRMQRLEPIFVPNQGSDTTVRELDRELRILKNKWILSHITLRTNFPRDSCSIKMKADEISQRVFDTYFQINAHRAVPSSFGKFATAEVHKIFK